MSFEIKHLLQGTETYRNWDAEHAKDHKNQMVNYPAICAILTKWSDSIFSNAFIKDYQFSSMSSSYTSEMSKEDDLDQRMSKTAMNLHRISYQSLLGNKPPTEQELAKVQKVFQDFANSIEGAANEQTRIEIQQISLHPRLVMRCSEMFIKHIAEQVGKTDTFNYDIDTILTIHSELHNKDEQIASAMRKWAEIAFKPEFATRAGIAELEGGVKPPYCSYYKFSFEDSFSSAAKYLASLALNANNKGQDLSDAEVKSIQEMFQDMRNHFEELHSGHILYTSKNEANKTLSEAKEAYDRHMKESAERKQELTAAYQKADAELKEAADAQKGSLADVLAPVVEKRKALLDAAKQKLDDTVKADQETCRQLDSTLTKAQAQFAELDKLAYKRSPVKEALAHELSDEDFKMLSLLSQNVPLAVICMQGYMEFAKNRASREVEVKSSWFKLW